MGDFVDSLPALPTDPEELMRVVTAAFEAGDLRPLLAAVHKDIVWKAASPYTNLFRFGGVHQKREGVMDVTAQIAMDYTFRSFKPREIIAKGDVVWGLFDVEADFEFAKRQARTQADQAGDRHPLAAEGRQDHRASGFLRHRLASRAAGRIADLDILNTRGYSWTADK